MNGAGSFQAAVMGLVLLHPFLRGCWDLWAQTAVRGTWAVLIAVGTAPFLRRDPAERLWGALLDARTALAPLVLFIGFGAYSARQSVFPHSADNALLNDFVAAAFFLAPVLAARPWRGRFKDALLASAALAGLGGAFSGGFRPGAFHGTLVNPNVMASLFLLTWPLTLTTCLRAADRRLKNLWAAAAAGGIAALLLSGSFLAYLILIVELAILFAVHFWPLESIGDSGRDRRFRLAFLALVGVAVVGAAVNRGQWTRLLHLETDRVGWGESAIHMWMDRPAWGVGPGAFGEAYPAHRMDPMGKNSLYAHNLLLEMLAERGLFGTLAFLLFLLVLAARFWTNGATFKRAYPAMLGMGGFVFYNMAHIGFSFPSAAWAFWTTAGYLWAETAPEGSAEGGRRAA